MKANPHIENLPGDYLFANIAQRRQNLQKQNPQAQIISLGIGDTTEPLPAGITEGLVHAARALGDRSTYTGYGPAEGYQELRNRIAARLYQNRVSANDVFISDGSKCDLGRLQILFGSEVSLAVQDPAYPAYVMASRILGQSKIHYWQCLPERGFFPDLAKVPRADVIVFCAPNNPTGAMITRKQLEELVAYAKKQKSLIVYDAAYAEYIRDPSLPKSIYEIPGAEEVAIETGSFSKMIGFTGVRLGWTVVPSTLKYDNGSSVQAAWRQVITTYFNGASNIAQQGALEVLTDKGMQDVRTITGHYLENARIIRDAMQSLGHTCYGGVHCPYVWVDFSPQDSWSVFEDILQRCHVVTTPGAGFGPAGNGFIRISGFGRRSEIETALKRMSKNLVDV